LENGAEWFASFGTEKSKGTKAFSLVGKVRNTGLIVLPMGMPLRQIIYDIGGGIIGDKRFKAVQTGGPSGGCVPEKLLDSPVDYEKLTEAGSMMGSGGMIVLDERTCMVDVARYFVKFLTEESCGKCVPCREGLKQMLLMLTEIVEGRADNGIIDRIQRLARGMKEGSLCDLGRSATNPVMSTLKHFMDEYETHIRDHKCPAGVCRKLTVFHIVPETCDGCAACVRVCPVEAIMGKPKEVHTIVEEKCIQCGACYDTCTRNAIVF
jgi:NADH-quinone oxidoreductase subunit F